MLSMYSWKEFSVCVLLLVAVYYAVILLMYYRSELQLIMSGRFKPSRLHSAERSANLPNSLLQTDKKPELLEQSNSSNEQADVQQDDNDPSLEFNQLLEKIQQSIIRAADEKMVKQELLWMIRSLLQQYHHLKTTDNIIAINDFVILLVENHCSISLGEDDISPLWN